MFQGTVSLYDLLKPDFKQAKAIGWKDAETEKEMQQIRKSLESEISGLEWDSVKQEIYQQLEKLLDISLGVVLARAWVSAKQVKNAIEKQNEEKSDAAVVIPLLTHKIQSKHEPKLKIMLNNVQIGELPLTVKFAFRLNGLLLKIQYGKLQSILAGKCKGVAMLAYQGVKLEEKQIAEFDLADEITIRKTKEEPPEEESVIADDIMTETRIPEALNTEITSEEETATIAPVSFAKKMLLLLVGLLISLLIIIAFMLFI